jgi:hypothetical protein
VWQFGRRALASVASAISWSTQTALAHVPCWCSCMDGEETPQASVRHHHFCSTNSAMLSILAYSVTQQGLWPVGRKHAGTIAEHLVEDISTASKECGYLQFGMAGHSLGGIIISLAADSHLSSNAPPYLTALLPICTPWQGVIATSLVSRLHPQLADLSTNGRVVRERGRRTFDAASRSIWCRQVLSRTDPIGPAEDALGASARYWTYWHHRNAAAVNSSTDPRFTPLRDFARAAAHVSIFRYAHHLADELEARGLRRITPGSRRDLYEPQAVTQLMLEPAARRSRTVTKIGKWCSSNLSLSILVISYRSS